MIIKKGTKYAGYILGKGNKPGSFRLMIISFAFICCMVLGFAGPEAAALTPSTYGVYVQDEADQLSSNMEEQLMQPSHRPSRH
jgi:hypothetical protein